MKPMPVRELTWTALFVVLLIVCGKMTVAIGPIPLTLQTAGCLLVGWVAGLRPAILAQLLYLFMGLIGFPVFAEGGGLHYLLKPSFGYLLGMAAASIVIAAIVDRADPKRARMTVPMALGSGLAGLILIYVVGVPYLFAVLRLYLGKPITAGGALQIGFLPFVIKDAVVWVILALACVPLRRASAQYWLDRSAKA